jgi:hypothetical protein
MYCMTPELTNLRLCCQSTGVISWDIARYTTVLIPPPALINRHHVVDNTTQARAREGSQLEGQEISGIASKRMINKILSGVI